MKIQNKNMIYMILSDITSTAGSTIFFLAMMWTVQESTNSAFYTSIVSFLGHIATVLFSFYAGTIIDKVNPKNSLMISLISSSIILFILFSLNYFFNLQNNIILIFIFIFLLFSSYSFTNPSESRLIPSIIDQENITKLFGFRSTSTQITGIVGTAIGGITLIHIGFNGTTLLNSITFLLSCFFISRIIIVNQDELKVIQNNDLDKLTLFEKIKDGITILKENTELYAIFLISILINVGSILGPLWVVIISRNFNASANDYGLIQTVGLIGGIFGSLMITKYSQIQKNKISLPLFIGISGATLLFISTLNDITYLYFIFPIYGFFQTLYSIIISSKIVELSPSHLRGRISGAVQSIGTLLIPICTIISGYISDIIDVRYIFSFVGIWTLSLSAFSFKMMKKLNKII